MNEKILMVDDDSNLLAACQRNLCTKFKLETALGGAAGLEQLAKNGPYALVLSDMHMPGMDGIAFLARVRDLSPDSVRMMLTGQADLETAVAAVNEGNIFRFLTKPCPSDLLAKSFAAGLQQYRLITSERELLEKTLRGSIKTMTTLLALVNPAAFSQGDRIKRYVGQMAKALDLPDLWQWEVAAMLSQIGAVTIPSETWKTHCANQPLTQAEATLISSVPKIGHDLIFEIPRLEPVAQMIEKLGRPLEPLDPRIELPQAERTLVGAHLLAVAKHYDDLINQRRFAHALALQELADAKPSIDPRLLQALRLLTVEEKGLIQRSISVPSLAAGMILAEDVRTKHSVLLVSRGQEVNPTLIKFLSNYFYREEIGETVEVLVSEG